jgi:hypothetical protein
MAANQPGVAQGLRNALTEMDNSDLDNRVQRSADWLRRGVDPTSNGTEDEIAQGLGKLSQQIQQAQKGMGQAKQGQQRGAGQDQAAALDQLERLRSQIESRMASRTSGKGDQTGQRSRNGQAGQSFSEGGRLSRSSQQSGSQQPGSANQSGSGQSPQSASGQPGGGPQSQGGEAGARIGGDLGNQDRGNQDHSNQDRGAVSGEVRAGGGRAFDGTAWNNINTGNNRYGSPRQQSANAGASGNPGDTEGDYQLGMRELNQLRQMVTADPQAAKDISELTRQMQHLDPSRFPGNPAMVEQMHREILTSLDRIELRLQREGVSSEARTGKPDSVPEGYKESVAEYYRQLSKNR